MQPALQYLFNTAVNAPDTPAIMCDERVLSYRDFLNKIYSLANLLSEEGLRKGDRAVIFTKDKTEFLVVCYSLMKIGAIAVPVSEHSTLFSLQEIVKDSTPSLLITSAMDLSELPQLRAKIKCKLFLIEEKNITADYSHSLALRGQTADLPSTNDEGTSEIRPEDKALIRYSVGANGKLQGFVFSQKNIISDALGTNEMTHTSAGARECIAAPLANAFGFSRCCSLFLAGGTVVLSNSLPDPVSLVQSVLRYRCNALSLMPSLFSSMLGHIEPLITRIGTQITSVHLGASFMPVEHKQRLIELFPYADVFMYYGTSEAPHSALLSFRSDVGKLDTAGHATLHTEICVLDEYGRQLGPLTTGEISLRGDNVMVCYWKNSELAEKATTSDGWTRTGDYGFVDEDGYLHVTGRDDEMIVMGGLKFSPVEIEEHIREHFPEHEMCVVGIPDPAGILGEIPVLCYQANNGKTITASDLSRMLSHKIDAGKIPRIVYRIDAGDNNHPRLTRKELRMKFLTHFYKSTQDEKQVLFNPKQHTQNH